MNQQQQQEQRQLPRRPQHQMNESAQANRRSAPSRRPMRQTTRQQQSHPQRQQANQLPTSTDAPNYDHQKSMGQVNSGLYTPSKPRGPASEPLLVEENDNVDYSRSRATAAGSGVVSPANSTPGLMEATPDTRGVFRTPTDNNLGLLLTDEDLCSYNMGVTPIASGGRKQIEPDVRLGELQRLMLFRDTDDHDDDESDDRLVSNEEKGQPMLGRRRNSTESLSPLRLEQEQQTTTEELQTMDSFGNISFTNSEFTLRTFMEHQRTASYLNGEMPTPEHLSMASNGGPPPFRRTETDGTEGGETAGGILGEDVLGLEYLPRKSRRTLPHLLLVCTVLLSVVMLSSTPNTFKAFIENTFWQQHQFGDATQVNGSTSSSDKAKTSQESQEGQHWHPLFPHGKRTADVEVKVPGKEKYQEYQQSRQQKHRRLQDEDDQGEDERPGANFDTQGFLNGDVEQELCPVTHTLISQSLILRSSYGNIFSVTTPDKPARKKERRRDQEGTTQGDTNDKSSLGEDGQPRRLQDDLNMAGRPQGDYSETGDYFDIDTEFESIYEGTGVETITINTLSLRMADFRPEEETHFEVWLYTGSGDNIEYNENDLDDDPSNDNLVKPSKGEYQASRAKFTDWILISEGLESELLPDTDFFDHNGHVFNIGAGAATGPLGRLDKFENMEDVNLAIKDWNDPLITRAGGMEATTAEGEKTNTYYFKIPEEKFMPLKLPKHNGKLTLFVTLDRVGLQYGYAAKTEFDRVDVTKHDYIDQTPSLDVLNGNVNLQMHVGEGVIFYPWMEEEFFYQTRRFLGKIWYDALIPCEYAPVTQILDLTETPSVAPTPDNTMSPSMPPSLTPTENGTYVAADLLISVLIKDGPLPPMPADVQAIFEDTVLDFVNDEFGDFCPLTWNEGATVADQEVSAVGGLPTGASSTERRRKGDGEGVAAERTPDGGGSRYLRQLLEPIFSPPKRRRSRMLQAITLLDATTVFDALYNSNSCPNKKPEELAELIETFINNNDEELLERLQAAHDYFKDAFGVSADLIAPVVVAADTESEEDKNLGAIIGGIIAALLLCCCCCLLPLLVVRRRKRKESKENEIIGEDVEWAHPVGDDHFPPLGGYREEEPMAGGDGRGDGYDDNRRRKRPDGSFPEDDETGPPIGLTPIPPGIRPPEDDTQMLHSHRFLDKEFPDKDGKKRPFGLPGRMPGEDEEGNPYGINIYPGGDYEQEDGEYDPNNLRHIEKQTENSEDSDWEPEHYEPDGGVHGYDRPQKPSPAIRPAWQRLPGKGEKDGSPDKKLNIKQLVLQRKKDLEAKKNAMRHVEQLQDGPPPIDEDQVFDKNEPDNRIEDLMSRIKDLETDKKKKYQRPAKYAEESDYERWKRLNIDNAELSSSDESEGEEDVDLAAARKKKKKKKKKADDYMLKFDDLDAYNRALAVHQDAYIHKWVKVKVQKEGEEDEGAELDAIEMDRTAEQGEGSSEDDGEFVGDIGGEAEDDGDKKPSANRRAMLAKQQTEYIGDMEDDMEDEPQSDRRSMLSKQKTEYIGDMGDLGGDNDEPAAPQSDPVKDEIVWLVGKVLPEQLDDVDALLEQFAGRETALRDTLRKKLPAEERDSKPPAPAAPAPKPKSALKSAKSTRKVGFGSDVAPAASASAPPDRRSQLSREKTEYIGSIRGMEEEDEPADRRSLLSKQKTEYIGSISGGMGDEDDDETPGDRRSLLSKQKTEHIGDLMDEEDEAPTDRRSRFSREKTEYIGDLGDDSE